MGSLTHYPLVVSFGLIGGGGLARVGRQVLIWAALQ